MTQGAAAQLHNEKRRNSFSAAPNVVLLLSLREGALAADVVSDKPQRDALVMVFIRMHGQGVLANEVFWELWLFPFGLLVYKSRFIPRILGVWLMLNCFAYLATSVTGILWPLYEQRCQIWVFPVMLGELAIMLWLMIVGARERQPLTTAA